MKILLIFILYLISGPVDCTDVIGYSGGSVIMISKINWYTSNSKYICKVKENDCTDIIRVETKRHQTQEGRFKLYSNINNVFTVLIRKLKPQDAGTYRFGLENQNATVNLKVLNDSCCGTKLKTAYVGQNITITCNYPGQYESNNKYVYKLDDDVKIQYIVDTDKKLQNGRFSISDDRSAKVLRVNLSDVREDDGIFYLFGVWNKNGSVEYFSFFSEIQLHVTDTTGLTTSIEPTTTTGTNMTISAALTETPSAVCFSSSAIIIGVCVCVALLLIGGFALMIYKLRHKRTQDYASSSKSKDNKPVTSDYDTDSANVYENVRMSSL